MNARVYLAELLGTFMFMMVGYMSVAAISLAAPATPDLAGRAVLVRSRPAGRDLRVRPHLRAATSTRPSPSRWCSTGARPPVEGVGYIVAQIIGAIARGGRRPRDASARTPWRPASPSRERASRDVSALILETVFTAIFLVGHPRRRASAHRARRRWPSR